MWLRSLDMREYRLIDLPVRVEEDAYEQGLSRIRERLSALPGIQSIYQIGSVSTPVISDLDVVAVFYDDVFCPCDPLEGLSARDRYLFIHRIYGAPRRLFDQACPLTLFHNYRHLLGEQIVFGDSAPGRLLQIQTALEYLVKMYVNAAVARVFGVLRLRGFFLHVKAVQYDLEYLNATSEPLADLTQRLIGYRRTWFERSPARKVLIAAVNEFYYSLEDFLRRKIEAHGMYLPSRNEHRIARSIILKPGERLSFRREGMTLPRMASALGRAYFSLQHRLGRFQFEVPGRTDTPPEPIAARFRVVNKMREYNRTRLPHFAPLTTSLQL